MTTWTMTFLPIQQILLNGGKMRFDDLGKKLMGLEPRRFRDVRVLEEAIDHYIACLDYDSETGWVSFNKEARTYAKLHGYERSVQYELHHSVKDMDSWQLYRLVTDLNSEVCYIGIRWEDLPKPEGGDHFPLFCDFRRDGKDGCSANCRVSKDVLRKYKLVK